MTRRDAPPLVCDMSAFDAAQRARYDTLTPQLFAGARATAEEVEEGYRFRFPAERFMALAEWVTLERRCCPFLAFTLALTGDEATLTLGARRGRATSCAQSSGSTRADRR